jgi:hypothetical protein
MLELTVGGGLSSGRFDLKTPTSKILVKGALAKAIGGNSLSAFIAAATACKLSITRYSNELGTKVICEKISLRDLLEVAAQNEGAIVLTTEGTTVTVNASIELSNAAAVALDGKDYISVIVEGANEFDSLQFNSFGAPISQNEHLKYSRIAVVANETVKFNCPSHYRLAVPADIFEKLRLKSLAGVVQEIELTELETIAADTNEITYIVDGLVVPFSKWLAFDLSLIESCELLCTGTGFALLLSNKNYE